MPNLGCPATLAMSLTRRLVDVPIRVQQPPSTAACDKGMRKRLGERLRDRAASSTTGALSTTIGVLLRKAEAAPDRATTIHRPVLPMRRHSATNPLMLVSSRPESSIA